MRISNAEVYLLNLHLLASEHCDSTLELHPVNLQPNLIHQFIISYFIGLTLLIPHTVMPLLFAVKEAERYLFAALLLFEAMSWRWWRYLSGNRSCMTEEVLKPGHQP